MIEPEIKLWRAVLDQAYEDAEAKIPSVVKTQAHKERQTNRYAAQAYLRADTPFLEVGLREVCELADVPPSSVINWARRRYRKAA